MNNQSNKESDKDLEVREDSLQTALDASDERQLAEIVDTISSHEALRQVSLMDSDDRDELMTLLPADAVA